MIVTKNWLEDFVDLQNISIAQIVDRFVNIGFEVEDVRDLGRGMERVRIGEITALARHPNADKLQICTIDIGEKESVQILTAATNVFVGAKVPCALDGADLPNGVCIKTTTMRGEISAGMLCSGEELCIDDSVYPGAEVDGIMILDSCARVGQGIAEFLGMDDVVLDIKVLANRPDCQSVMGLARELAAAISREFRPKSRINDMQPDALPLEVRIETELCPLYYAGQILDYNNSPSIELIRRRLKAVGIAPKNAAVDLTNYVLWETGQPIHAFDYDKIRGNTIIVRNAREGEKLLGFDDREYALTPDMVVVADATQPIAIAGVMGGKEFSISKSTRNIVIESAVYDRVSIRRTSRALGLRTDVSARFERGVVGVSAEKGVSRALELAQLLGLGRVSASIKKQGELDDSRHEVVLKIDEVAALLGIEIPVPEMVQILDKIDIASRLDGDNLICSVPAIRSDVTRSADIIEEIIRFYGFDAITPTYGERTASLAGGKSSRMRQNDKILGYVLASGAYAVRTYSFRSPVELDKLLLPVDDALRNCVKIANPLSLDYSILRSQMIGSLLDVASFNDSHKNKNIKICEIGKVFLNDRTETHPIPTEQKILAYLATGRTDFFELKSLTELIASKLNITFGYRASQVPFLHPNVCAEITVGKQVVGLIGKVHPQVSQNYDLKLDAYYFELNLDKLPDKKFKKFKPLPKFPAALRDLCVVVDQKVAVGDILSNIKKAAGNLLEDAELFDIYQGENVGEGKKSVAFNLVFRKPDATLTQDEVNALFDKILGHLETTLGAKLRV